MVSFRGRCLLLITCSSKEVQRHNDEVMMQLCVLQQYVMLAGSSPAY
jgi:hypothetical protein